MQIIVDTREQLPYSFQGDKFEDVTIASGTLQTGDYSLAGYEGRIAIERKELSDFIACVGRERRRFEAELERGRGLDFFGVVVEASKETIRKGEWRHKVHVNAVLGSINSFTVNYRIPFYFSDSRSNCELMIYEWFRHYLGRREQEAKKQFKEAV